MRFTFERTDRPLQLCDTPLGRSRIGTHHNALCDLIAETCDVSLSLSDRLILDRDSDGWRYLLRAQHREVLTRLRGIRAQSVQRGRCLRDALLYAGRIGGNLEGKVIGHR